MWYIFHIDTRKARAKTKFDTKKLRDLVKDNVLLNIG
jgi:hypothetical protein